MKKQIFLFIAIIFISTASAIYAQTNVIKADIPFDFTVKDKTLPAGKYIIRNIDTTSQGFVWKVGSDKKQVTLLAMTNESADRSGKAKMVFHRYGNQYFLSSFQTLNSKITLPKSRAERNLQRESEKHLAKLAMPEVVVIEAAIE
jgi:hypothetical protein